MLAFEDHVHNMSLMGYIIVYISFIYLEFDSGRFQWIRKSCNWATCILALDSKSFNHYIVGMKEISPFIASCVASDVFNL